MKNFILPNSEFSSKVRKVGPEIPISEIKPGENFFLKSQVDSDLSEGPFLMLEIHPQHSQKKLKNCLAYVQDGYKLYINENDGKALVRRLLG